MIDFERVLKENKVTQAELARRLGIPPQNVSRMLKNDDIKLSNVYKIAEALQVPVRSFFDKEHDSVSLDRLIDMLVQKDGIIQQKDARIQELTDKLLTLLDTVSFEKRNTQVG